MVSLFACAWTVKTWNMESHCLTGRSGLQSDGWLRSLQMCWERRGVFSLLTKFRSEGVSFHWPEKTSFHLSLFKSRRTRDIWQSRLFKKFLLGAKGLTRIWKFHITQISRNERLFFLLDNVKHCVYNTSDSHMKLCVHFKCEKTLWNKFLWTLPESKWNIF